MVRVAAAVKQADVSSGVEHDAAQVLLDPALRAQAVGVVAAEIRRADQPSGSCR